ncbi:LPS export ABC transporter permease LptG [Aestuariibius sp. HNIBRBA575]|uniref:LPS export ABC transporter permease LptG n=1 Tax=Aestuariibius sp. HNIBRBA575 TaxID=3233343 RepID=UPI0034A343C9
MILHRYFARRFTLTFLAVLLIFGLMLGFLDLVEQIRTFSNSEAQFSGLLTLTLLNLPGSLYQILPLLMIITSISLFLALARSSELVVTRAVGRSAMRALVAPVVVTLLVGTLAVAAMNPIVAATSSEYDSRRNEMRGRGTNVLQFTGDAVWLRQGDELGQTVIRAAGANLEGTLLRGVTFLEFSENGGPSRRIHASSARLQPGEWVLLNAKVWTLANTPNPEATATSVSRLSVPSSLTADEIRDSFGTPSSIPIWDLPTFIERLKTAGFSARRHQVWLQMELALPLFLVGMVLIGAAFTMQHQRGSRTSLMVLFALMLSFGFYFIRNFAQILGENGNIPVLLAAWAPPLAALGLAMGLILHLEDG